MLAAGGAHAFLASLTAPALPWAAGAAFVLSFALARLSLPLALMPALLLTYISPAVMMVVFGATPGSHDVLVWLALMAGPIVATSDWSRWHSPPAWTPWIAAWGLVIALTWPIVAGREIDFSLVAARTFDTPNGIGAGPPPLSAASVINTALGQLVGILWLDLLWARFGSSRLGRAERWVFVPLVISIAISSIAGLYQRLVDINWLGVQVFATDSRASGLMLDANSFGMAAAIWGPLTLALTWRLGRASWLGLAPSGLLLAGAWTSGSRTAFLTAAVGLCALFVASMRRLRTRQMRIVQLAVLLIAASAVLFVVLRSPDRNNPIARFLGMRPTPETGGLPGFAKELWDRDGYGIASMHAIADHPWTGVGVGAFNQLSTDFAYLTTGVALASDNAQNWWRQQVAELGVLGAAPGIVLSLMIVGLIWRGVAPPDRRDAAIVVRTVLVVIGIVSLLAVPTQHPALWLTFVTLVYWMGALVDLPSTAPRPAWRDRAVWAGVLIVPIVVAAGQLRSARDELRVPMRAVRVGFPYAYGFTAPDNDSVPWTGRHAVAVLRAEHAYFALTATPPKLDTPVRLRLWRGHELIADHELSGGEPVTRIIGLPAGQKFLMVESDVSALSPDGRGLKMVGQWLREVPPDAHPDTIVP